MRRNQWIADLADAVNNLNSDCSESSTRIETQVVNLGRNFAAMTGQFLNLESQITVLTDRLDRADITISSLVKSEIPLSETTGLQRTLRELTDNVTRCTCAMGADHAKLRERFDNLIRSNNHQAHNHQDHKRPRHEHGQIADPKDKEVVIIQERPPVPGQASVPQGPNPNQGAKSKTNIHTRQPAAPTSNVEAMDVASEVAALTTTSSEHEIPRQQGPVEILQQGDLANQA